MYVNTPIEQELPTESPQLLTIILQRRKVLIAGALIGLAIGLLIALIRPTTYTASATLLFPSAPTSKLAALAGNSGGDQPSIPLLDGALQIPQPGTSTSTAMVILQSRSIALEIASVLNLQRAWKLTNNAEVLKRFADGMQCKVGKNGELIVGFQDKSKKLAYHITAALVQTLEDKSLEMGLNPAEQSTTFIAEQLAQAQAKMDRAQQQMLAFQQKYRIVSLPDQAKALAQQYSSIQNDLTASRVEAVTNMRLVNMQATAVKQLITSCIDPAPTADNTLGELYKKVSDLQTELAQLRLKFTQEHPDVVEKTHELGLAQQALRAAIERQMALLNTGSSPAISDAVVKAATSQAKLAGLQSAFKQIQQQVEALPQQEATYARLSTELDADGQEVKLFREELEKARIVAQRHGPSFIIVDPPAMPVEHDPMHRMLFLIIAIMLGSCLALLIPYWDWARRQMAFEAMHSEKSLTE